MMTTAQTVFTHIATLIRSGFVPADVTGESRTQAEGRARATAATFEQVGQIGGDLPLSLADARIGYQLLSVARAEDEPGNVTGRRKTCDQVAALILGDGGDLGPGGDPRHLAAVFDAVATAFASTDDPRQRAMRDTAIREATELRAGDPQAEVAAVIAEHPDDIVIGGKGDGPVVLP